MWYSHERIFNLKLCKDFAYFHINFTWDSHEKILTNSASHDFHVKFKSSHEAYVDFTLNFSPHDSREAQVALYRIVMEKYIYNLSIMFDNTD